METAVVREQGLDKFYTNSDTVDLCMKKVYEKYKPEEFNLTIEPSAGNGSFVDKIIGNRIALDISPERYDIIKQDYFDFLPQLDKILVVGNPPFGKVSSLAVKFFNHSAKFADVIAFVVPRTFRRVSIQNRLSLDFVLVDDITLPIKPCCFSVPVDVKCCFQIWERVRTPRECVNLPMNHEDFEFLKLGKKDEHGQPTVPMDADFAIRAYGGACGEIKEDIKNLSAKSWHFIKSNSKVSKEDLITRFKKLDYSMSTDTSRQNSIGRSDLVYLYTTLKDSYFK